MIGLCFEPACIRQHPDHGERRVVGRQVRASDHDDYYGFGFWGGITVVIRKHSFLAALVIGDPARRKPRALSPHLGGRRWTIWAEVVCDYPRLHNGCGCYWRDRAPNGGRLLVPVAGELLGFLVNHRWLLRR